MNAEVKKRGSGVLVGGWVCMLLGIGLMFLSLWTVIFYAPLFLVAFILAIVAMSQSRVGAGITLLLSSLFVPFILFVSLGAVRTKELSNKLNEATAANDANSRLELQSYRCSNAFAGSTKAVVIGEVKNVGSIKLDAVMAKGTFYDASKNVIDTGSAILDVNPLMPGQTSSFKAYGPDNPAVKSCSVVFTKMFGGEIQTVKKS